MTERSPIYKLSRLDSNGKSATSRMIDQDGNKLVNIDPVVAVQCLGSPTGDTSLLTAAPFKGNLVDSSDKDILIDTTLDNTVSDEVADQVYSPQDEDDAITQLQMTSRPSGKLLCLS